MQIGAITSYVDLAQIILYMFWLFFAGIIFYLVRENHREGYPMESDGLSRAAVQGSGLRLDYYQRATFQRHHRRQGRDHG